MKPITEEEWEVKKKKWDEKWKQWKESHKGKLFLCNHVYVDYEDENEIRKKYPDIPSRWIGAIIKYPHGTIVKETSSKYHCIQHCIRCNGAYLKRYAGDDGVA